MARTPGIQPTLPRDVNHQVRQARALELRLEGYSLQEIANRVGVHVSTASRMIRRALAQRQVQGVDALRQLEHERSKALTQIMWALAKNGNTRAAGVVTRLMDRKARLLGLDLETAG